MIEPEVDLSKIVFKKITDSNFENFNCDNNSMSRFLQEEAYFFHISRQASTTLVYYQDELVAYFTLRRKSINIIEEANEQEITALDLSRLAVSKYYQKIGVGTYILDYIKDIAYTINERYIQTDALCEKWKWYEKRGFSAVIEDEINSDNPSDCIYMIIDLYDSDLIDAYFDE